MSGGTCTLVENEVTKLNAGAIGNESEVGHAVRQHSGTNVVGRWHSYYLNFSTKLRYKP